MGWDEKVWCRVCKGRLGEVLDLGLIYPSEFVDKPTERTKVPLTLVRCERCGLVQLKHTVDRDELYKQYWYQSGINADMRAALKDIVDAITWRVDLSLGDIVVDIGANDGTMLAMYPGEVITVGFDPALNLADAAKKNCYFFINDYFSYDTYPIARKAKVITTIAMLYDLDRPSWFVEDVKKVLLPDGLWVIQLTDLMSMFLSNEFTAICHEHLEYYSFGWLINFLASHGLQVFDAEKNNVNGGSIRLFVSYPDVFPTTDDVYVMLENEEAYMDSFDDPFSAFAERVEEVKRIFTDMLQELMEAGRTVMGLGASTKANTLLQYYGIGPDLVKCIGEVNEEKFGLKTVGTDIPIVPEKEVLEANPDYLIVFIWQFRSFFEKVLKDYMGRIIYPLPNVEMVSKGEVRRL